VSVTVPSGNPYVGDNTVHVVATDGEGNRVDRSVTVTVPPNSGADPTVEQPDPDETYDDSANDDPSVVDDCIDDGSELGDVCDDDTVAEPRGTTTGGAPTVQRIYGIADENLPQVDDPATLSGRKLVGHDKRQSCVV